MTVQTILNVIVTAITTFLGGVGQGTLDFFDSITSTTVTVDGVSSVVMSNLMVFILALLGVTIALAVIRGIWALIGGYRRRA